MSEKLFIYNHDLFFLGRIKSALKRLVGKVGGPEMVERNLILGLLELNQEYSLNNPQPKNVVCVLSGVKTLKWAIEQKKLGKVQKIIAGPNMVVIPEQAEGILRHPFIDKVIVPSQWVKDVYAKLAPELEPKIYIWPAGVDLPEVENINKDIDFLVFNKLPKSNNLPVQIREYLLKQNKKYKEITYGTFRRSEYLNLLRRSKFLIYLSESESQGLAMFEAWAYNVTTLVWDRGYMQFGQFTWTGNTSSPYLVKETGIFFKDFNDFKVQAVEAEVSQSFTPRKYIEQNFTNKLAAENYLKIVNAQ
jgi:hypothetical protein